jgi:hypothetical protein
MQSSTWKFPPANGSNALSILKPQLKERHAMKEHELTGKNITDSDAIRTVIAAKAALDAAKREIAALKKDRDDLLSEYTDIRNARQINIASKKPTQQKTKENRIRVCFGDVHGMMMDRQAVSAMLADIKLLEPDEIVIGGDLVECGGWLAKHQPLGFIALSDYTYAEDIEAANQFLDRLIEAAPNAVIYFVEGNHEDRVERWIMDTVQSNKRDAQMLWDAFAPASLLRLKERNIEYYRRSLVYVDGAPRGWIKLGKMYFTHTLGRGKNAASQAARKTAGNVTYFCTHREDTASVVFPSVGLVKAFNPGCLCVMQPVWMHSDPTEWSQGYGVDVIAKSGNFQRLHVPIWRGESLASAMIERFKS